MKRAAAMLFVAILLLVVGVTFIARTYFTSWLWGIPLVLLGGVMIGWLFARWLRKLLIRALNGKKG